MKLNYTTRDGRMTVELEGKTQQELFQALADFQEIFEDNICKVKIKGELVTSDKVRFVVRENKNSEKFFEKVCEDWEQGLVGFRKSFGCKRKDGGLFPKDMPEENRIPGLSGWHKWMKPQAEDVKTDKSPSPF